MKKSHHHETEAAQKGQTSCSFIAANGYRGFRSKFDEVYQTKQYEHLFIIKGGPGTGKSHAMKEIGKNAEKIGADCEYIYCSSDPDSLDGLIMKKGGCRIGVLDGTAPHTRCTEIPGAVDELVNLGEFWDSTRLSPHREKIFSLQQKKTQAYRRAYRYLRIAGEADAYLTDLLEPCVDQEKLERSIARSTRKIPDSKAPGMQLRYRQACSMKGLVHLPIHFTKDIGIADYLGSARFYLASLKKVLLAEERHAFTLYPCCYTDTVTDAILLSDSGILFSAREDEEIAEINMKRFLRKDALSVCRSDIRHLRNICRDMQEHAIGALKEAGNYHFALEEIYGDAMNFKAKEACVAKLSEKILSYLQSGG